MIYQNANKHYNRPTLDLLKDEHEMVELSLKNLISSTINPCNDSSKMTVPIAKSETGKIVEWDMAKSPKLIIAGGSGTGKTIFLHSTIASLLYKYSPNELNLVMFDPKRVELSYFEGTPHMPVDIQYDLNESSKTIDSILAELERRHTLLKNYNGIDDYNNSLPASEQKLPHIVLVIDEIADFMCIPNETKDKIISLLATSNTEGIYVLASTQRTYLPISDEDETSLFNLFNTRIALKVYSKEDSLQIINCAGAENLEHRGDMLILDTGTGNATKAHAPYILPAEIRNIVKHMNS